jgi:uncharacterized membrane protein
MTSINVPADVFLDENKPADWLKWKIVRDKTLHDMLANSTSWWNHPRIYTELPENLRIAWVVHGVNRQLVWILEDSEEQDIRKIMNHLIWLRSLVNLYFDTLKIRPPYIKNKPIITNGIADVHKKLEEYIQRLAFFLPDPTGYHMKQIITTISLFLWQLIHFYQLDKGEIYHLPGQIQPIAHQYQKGYYVLDSYYKYDEETNTVKNMQLSLHQS